MGAGGRWFESSHPDFLPFWFRVGSIFFLDISGWEAKFRARFVARFIVAEIPPNSADIENWLRLIRADGVGPVTFVKLLNHFGSADKALGASAKQLEQIDGIGVKTAKTIAAGRHKFDAKAELNLAARLGVWIISLRDSRYPILLKKIYDPPPVLYVRGSLTKSDNLAISIVGSRLCSAYGREQAARFAHLLASAGFTICSGMARGIDSDAHYGALSASGRTIAVQGCGLARIFPPGNKKLFGRIAESGACISELPLQFEPRSENFPVRNRIIAGLALGTIVVEAGFNSGALITAKYAIDYNRDVLAVPGKIDSPLSRGTHQLIKEGAKLIESVTDITEALGYVGRQLSEHTTAAAERASEKIEPNLFGIGQLNLSTTEKAVYHCLNDEPLHIEQIIAQTGLHAAHINSSLISLQLKGVIRQQPGSFFLRRQAAQKNCTSD